MPKIKILSCPDTPQYKNGGVLSKDKARQILADGTVYGKPITERQKKFFGFIAGGGNPKEYNDGGEVMKYDEGGVIIDPDVVGAPTDGGTPFDLGKGYSSVGGADARGEATGGYKPSGGAGGGSDILSGFSKVIDQMGGASQLFNIGKFIAGITGANKPLPQFEKPAAWNDYIGKLKAMSEQGLTPQERSASEASIGNNRAADLANAREISGGNSAFALGASGGAINRSNDAERKVAATDASLRRENIDRYGKALGTDVSMDEDQFARDYALATKNKESASALAKEGLQSLIDKPEYERTYGKGSLYEQLLQSQIAQNKAYTDAATKGNRTVNDQPLYKGNSTSSSTTATDPLAGMSDWERHVLNKLIYGNKLNFSSFNPGQQ